MDTIATPDMYRELDEMLEREARREEQERILREEYSAQERLDYFGIRG